ncbi:hypothetical protein [Nevskia ramosa]|nr:hypothetical protein [Nevskia ramosa]
MIKPGVILAAPFVLIAVAATSVLALAIVAIDWLWPEFEGYLE